MPDTQTIPAVTLTNVSHLYGDHAVLRNLSLTLPAGSSVVLLGENGAGKSTLLRLLAGLTRPTHGTIELFAERPLDIRNRVAYMSHATMLYDELTALENLEYFASLSLFPVPYSLFPALEAVGLDPTNPRRVGEYSQGMRQRAALARTLLTNPDLLLLDEPFSNLDAASAQRMIARLQSYLAEKPNRTLILTTHQAELARPLAQTTLVLHEGRLTEEVTR